MITAEKLTFDRVELTASHPYARPHLEGEHHFHGGFVASGDYVPPRTLGRAPAIAAWQAALVRRGWPLVDDRRQTHAGDDYPNIPQQKLLLAHGCIGPLWDMLTVMGIFEGKGETMRYVPRIDLQALIEEDITATTTGHLWNGLFWAHGVDEAGDRDAPEQGGGHKQMWFTVRDLLFGENAHPMPQIPPMYPRPVAGREMPDLPEGVEKLVVTCMNTLKIEVSSYYFSDLTIALCRDPENFPRRREQAETAARLVQRIVADEASHVAYLQTFLSELRSFTFKTLDGGRMAGAAILDPVWARVLAWPDPDTRQKKRNDTRAMIKAEAEGRLAPTEASAFLARFDAMASP